MAVWYIAALDFTMDTRASSAFDGLTIWSQLAKHFTRRECLSTMFAGTFTFLNAVHLVITTLCASWGSFEVVGWWTCAAVLYLHGQMSLSGVSGHFGKLSASHGCISCAWYVTDNSAEVSALVDWINWSGWVDWFDWFRSLAYAAALLVDVRWKMGAWAGSITRYGGLKSFLQADHMSGATTWVFDRIMLIDEKPFKCIWFMTLAGLWFDTVAILIFDSSIDTLAASTTNFTDWTLKGGRGHGLAGFLAHAFGWFLSSWADLWYWSWFFWWNFLTYWTAFTGNLESNFGVWIAGMTFLGLVDDFVSNTKMFHALMISWGCLSWPEYSSGTIKLHLALTVSWLDALESIKYEVPWTVAAGVALGSVGRAVWVKEVAAAASLHACCEDKWC